ncbi:PepSY domain-containing protein [Aneurinibacillus sp. REN35]|uniref:PepSY domain-containing protein n=1 Tax=Aneurinibacillus sp. REN35 TaxID=3237286 RepID=UPI0035272462
MNKRLLVSALSTGLILSGFGITSASNQDKDIEKKLMTEKQAIQIAERAAKGTVTKVNLEEDNDQYVYEVELETKTGEAEADINAITGDVIELTKESATTVKKDDRSSYPELDVIAKQIDKVQGYKIQTVTDHKGKRILLFVDQNGKKQYKTIFVKNTHRLKIIELNGGLFLQVFSYIQRHVHIIKNTFIKGSLRT